MQHWRPVVLRFLFAWITAGSMGLSACQDPAPSIDCALDPCADSCAPDACDARCIVGCALDCEPCSTACADEGLAPESCFPPPCDPFCDPCQDDCHACDAHCAGHFAGPDVTPLRCEATVVRDQPGMSWRWRLDFQVPSDASSWILSVMTDDVESVRGVELTLPDGQAIVLDDLDNFTLHQQQISPSVVGLLMPSAPRYIADLQPGEHALIVEAAGETSPCWSLTPQLPLQEDLPFQLRIRLVGVGESLGSVEDMRQNALLIEALQIAQNYFSDAGIALYITAWETLDDADRAAYGEIKSFSSLRGLLRAVPPPTPSTAAEALIVNMALIDRFGGEYALIGLTGGLPGPAALHGLSASGVVVSTALLTRIEGPKQIGAAIAHELGHYLGLRHTSAGTLIGPDALEDTPVCPPATLVSRPSQCPDVNNMMFPRLSVSDENTWSDEQKQVMRWHPSVTQRTE